MKSNRKSRCIENQILDICQQIETNTSEIDLGMVVDAYKLDKILTLKWLMFARDIRGGLGMRKIFRDAMVAIAQYDPDSIRNVIEIIPEYGRFDDLWVLLDNPKLKGVVIEFVRKQLTLDVTGTYTPGKSISLLAKWMPSLNATSRTTKKHAKMLCSGLHMSEKEYRKLLVSLRGILDVVEQKMSKRKWEDINYYTVPAKANVLYNAAFLRHDYDGREEYLKKQRGIKEKCLDIKGLNRFLRSQKDPVQSLLGFLNSQRYSVVESLV